ncbi:MAG: hypothetical protein HY825_18970 [Acidobacteria bacterium]|nr:hypothetical protein [Acidobacteriota bacterium]
MRRTVMGLVAWAVTVGVAVAAAPVPRYPGAGTSVAIDRGSGRIAICHDSKLEIYADGAAASPVASFDVPNASARLLEFRGDTVAYTFTLAGEKVAQFLAVGTDGYERLLWPNDGIGESFPTATSRLTLDGKGLADTLVLGPKVRAEMGVPGSAADGAGVVVTYRFAGEKMLIRFSESFHHTVAVTPDDLVIALRDGAVLRYRSGEGKLWEKAGVTAGPARIVDADPAAGTALLLGEKGSLVALDLAKGDVRWRWKPVLAAETPADARLLRDGGVIVQLGGDSARLAVLDPAAGKIVRSDLLAELEARGVAGAGEAWRASSSLAEVGELAGPVLLVRGPDGIYTLPLH